MGKVNLGVLGGREKVLLWEGLGRVIPLCDGIGEGSYAL